MLETLKYSKTNKKQKSFAIKKKSPCALFSPQIAIKGGEERTGEGEKHKN